MPSTADEIRELRAHFKRGDRMVAVHYACENLYEAKDHPPAISCVAYCPIGPGLAGMFSQVDAPQSDERSEKWVLEQYFGYIQQNPTAVVVHWNMSKADYGFAALEARYRYLFNAEVPYKIPEDRTFDLDGLIGAEYGPNFVSHPKLLKLSSTNGLRRNHALTGKDEADRMAAGDHGAVRRSTDEKVRWIAILAERFLSSQLITDRSVGSVAFADGHLDAVETVITVAQRSRDIYRELAYRHNNRPTIALDDEYDDQDFMRALLRMFFDDVRPENYTPEYAGANSRVDFLLPAFKLAIELKHTRASLNSKQLGEELTVDVARYSSRDDIRHLVCVVFDYGGRLRNPRGLEADLGRNMTQEGTGVTVVILDR